MGNNEMLHAFENGVIDPEKFSHGDHIWLTWQYLASKSVPETMVAMSRGLRWIAESVEQPEGYHETLTCAWVCLIATRRAQAGEGQSWAAFRRTNPDLFQRGREVMARYYTGDTLKSTTARTNFLMPDRLANPTDCVSHP